MKGNASSCTLAAALLGGSLAAFYAWKVRPWMVTWGTEGNEASQPGAGDEHVPEPMVQATWAVTIGAPPEEVWPWLVQMGLDRGGFDSYDWLDNEDQPSATIIIPELQDLQEGDEILLDRKAAVRVSHLDPPQAMVWALLGAEVELGLIVNIQWPTSWNGSRAIARASSAACGSASNVGWRCPTSTCLTNGSTLRCSAGNFLASRHGQKREKSGIPA